MISGNVLLREGRHAFRVAVDAVSRSRNGGRWLCRSQFVHCSGMQMERGYHRLRTAFHFVGGGIVCCILSLTSRRVYEFTRSQRRVGLFLFAVSRTQPRAVRRDGEVLFDKFSPRGSRLFNAGRGLCRRNFIYSINFLLHRRRSSQHYCAATAVCL